MTTSSPHEMTAERLSQLLEDSGRSMYWLAGQLGVSRNSVWRWARGSDPVPPGRVGRIEELLSTQEEAA